MVIEAVEISCAKLKATLAPEVSAIVEVLEPRTHLTATFEAFISGPATQVHGSSVSVYLWTTGGTASSWTVNWDGTHTSTYNAPPGGFPVPYMVTSPSGVYASANSFAITATATPSGGGAGVAASYAMNGSFGYTGTTANHQGETADTPSGATGDASGKAMAIDTSSAYPGYIYVASKYGTGAAVTRFSPSGAVDALFGSSGTVTIPGLTPTSIAVSPDGSLVAVGGGDNGWGVAVINVGSAAVSWTDSALAGSGNGGVNAVTFEDDDLGHLSVVPAGWVAPGGGGTLMAVDEVQASTGGAVAGWNSGCGVFSFSTSGSCAQATAIADGEGADDGIFLAGWTSYSGGVDFTIARVNDDGTLDTGSLGFTSAGYVRTNFGTRMGSGNGAVNVPSSDYAYGLFWNESTGEVVAAGVTNAVSTADHVAVGEWNAVSGSLIGGFGPYGTNHDGIEVGPAGYAYSVTQNETTGAIDTGGTTGSDMLVTQYTSAGLLDTGFGSSGSFVIDLGDSSSNSSDIAYSIGLKSDGSILLGGSTTPSGGSGKIGLVCVMPANTIDIT